MSSKIRDFATVLTHDSLLMAKTWRTDGKIEPYSTAKYFKARTVDLRGFADLVELLTILENSPRSCVIRGRYRGDDYSKEHNPEHKPMYAQRLEDLWEDVPHHWFLAEVDNFEPIGCDPCEDPVSAIDEFISTMPNEFHNASYYWQLSNSAGHESNAGKLKAHIWFWLDRPYGSEHLRAWVKGTNVPVDPAVLQTVQVHYTSRPQFERGMEDPIAIRSGVVERENKTVDLRLRDIGVYDEQAKLTRRKMLDATYASDRVATRLFERNMVIRTGREGQLFIECPCADRHTGEGGETSTVYYPPNTGGYASGNFKCLHAHCIDSPQSDFTIALGFNPIDEFDVLDVDDTAPTAPTPESVKEKSPRFQPVRASRFVGGEPTYWLIKKVIPDAKLVVLYGPSGSGKSFMALDLACAICNSDNWRGYKIPKPGRVVYVASEGAKSFGKRIEAYSLEYGIPIDDIDLYVIADNPSVMKGDDVRDLIRAIHALGPVRLIVMDTLARAMTGGNENASEDMGMAISQCDVIATVLKTTVMLIHHSGKDDAKGARGHSSLKAAADAELEVSRSDDSRVLHITKQKDGEDGLDFGFKLREVKLGEDEDGDDITSCVCVYTDVTRDAVKKRATRGENEKFILSVFAEHCASPAVGMTTNELIEIAIKTKGEPDTPRERSTLKSNLRRALSTLIRDGVLESIDGVITQPQDL